MKKSSWIQITVVAVFFFLIGIWTVDTGVSAMVTAAQNGNEMGATNGFWARTPVKQYHLGLLIVLLSSLFLALTAVRAMLHDLEFQEGTE